MKFIYILEDDERIQKDLFDTLKNIDSKLVIRFFPNLAQFHEWLKVAMHEGAKSLAAGGVPFKDDTSESLAPASTHELRLVIAKNEFLGVQNMGLIKRARDFFLRKKICSEQEPTSLIITAFDSPDFDIKLAEERIINNVIFKPFDKLILKQHLEYALTGHHPLNSSTITSFQLQSTIEMLKDVTIQGISEIGFTTVNNHEIQIGSLAKYYSDLFKTEDKKSVFAYCKSCKEISTVEFLCEFHFLGMDNNQISAIRRHILTTKKAQIEEIKHSFGRTNHVLILEEDDALAQEYKNFLTDKFSNIECYIYKNSAQLQSDLLGKDTVHRQNLPTQFDFAFVNIEFLGAEKQKSWDELCKNFSDRAAKAGFSNITAPDLYLISRRKISPDEMKSLAAWARDVFFTHLDKTYVYKKLLAQRSILLNKESAQLNHLKEQHQLKVANPVEIKEISEAGLVLKYYRAIGIGSFREFILWRPDELETPEIIGTVNFHEKEKGEKEFYYNHFVFFGMRDYYLKHIRLWLRGAFIKAKEK